MRTTESSPAYQQEEVKLKIDNRLNISPEIIVAEQLFLTRLMVPEEIRPYVKETNGEEFGGIQDGLLERWFEKYSALYREFCDSLDIQVPEEKALAGRLVSGHLTSDDYVRIQKVLEDAERENVEEGTGGLFFKDEAEIEVFLKQYTH